MSRMENGTSNISFMTKGYNESKGKVREVTPTKSVNCLNLSKQTQN